MFSSVWNWAGTYRTAETNIGVAPAPIPSKLFEFCEQVKSWIDFKSYSLDEIAVRFHHGLVLIHPFPNGNGRHARLACDLFLRNQGLLEFSWGSGDDLIKVSDRRRLYIQALKKVDQRNFSELIFLSRS